MKDANRIPVIVGVGQINDRPEDPLRGLDSLGLMEAALRAADADAGGGWLSRLDSLAVVDQLSFRQMGPLPLALAERLGARPRIHEQTAEANGDSPVRLLHEAANRVASGAVEVAAVVGGEALRTAARRAALAAGDAPSAHNAATSIGVQAHAAYRKRYGLNSPVDVYPLYENAGRAAYGQTLAEAQRESGEIWSRFSQVAAGNPGAWIREPLSVEEIVTPSASNRPIAFPYWKRMVANSAVNQGAGFLVTSLANALARGVPEDRLVYVGRGAAAHEPEDFLARDGYASSPSMAVSLRRTLELNGLTVDMLDFVELYSCFPCVPKMARRVLGWPLEKPATVFGGLTFGGGPIANYMSHAVVSMVQRLRVQGRHGLLFGNGGFATHNHSLVLTREPQPAGTLPQPFEHQAEADAARGPVPPFVEGATGPGRIETYTVLYERDGSPRFGVIVARGASGERFLAKVPAHDTAGIDFLCDGKEEPIGSEGHAVAGPGGDILWHRSSSYSV
ncbi:acetyl-CoA acetyltransferase [Corallococcus sp. AB030]|uniref:acetyl-CoA acetyltransferase n=1 Tax=Corallococcus TaxID=83461 RepID=UPI000EDCB668|nr:MULTISPECIES: acetyl-CoA acetyltransferase [Corallococcus]NRD58114.1 acetyl-CoA acetyltransferase [Corallococcus exiguus]RKI17862.1 acetyl-CoA acetyltransferase [Corallococcus sp. AB030]